jgi:hypothetical protein
MKLPPSVAFRPIKEVQLESRARTAGYKITAATPCNRGVVSDIQVNRRLSIPCRLIMILDNDPCDLYQA